MELWHEDEGGTVLVHLPDGSTQALTCGSNCRGPLLLDQPVALLVGMSEARLEATRNSPTSSGGPNETFSAVLPFHLTLHKVSH
jgi:hypothetical protein